MKGIGVFSKRKIFLNMNEIVLEISRECDFYTY